MCHRTVTGFMWVGAVPAEMCGVEYGFPDYTEELKLCQSDKVKTISERYACSPRGPARVTCPTPHPPALSRLGSASLGEHDSAGSKAALLGEVNTLSFPCVKT